MKVHLTIATLFLALTLCPNNAACQTQAGDSLNGYAIHATYQDRTIMFYPMHGPKPQGAAGFTIPAELVVKRATKDSERVSYIRVDASLQGKLWKVEVSVRFGEFFDQGDKVIATYQLREGEKANVKELAQYGIKLFDVSVVRVERVPALQPAVINRTHSIAVLNVKTVPLPMPYRIVLKNMSDKAVQALEIVASNGRGTFALKWPEGTLDKPLIEAGEEYKTEISSEKEYKSLPTSEYLAEQLQLIEVNTVVFTDGTYEGNPDLALWQRAKAFGNRLQLDRILSLIQSTLGTADDDSAFDQFKKAVSLLDEIVEPAPFEELQSQFPILSEGQKNSMRDIVRRSLHDIKASLNIAIAEFERGSSQITDTSFKAWLEKIKERYERWRANLP